VIAAPVLEHAGRARVVANGYAETDGGFVVALGAPRMPNGMSATAPLGAMVELRGEPVWDPKPVVRARPPLPGDPRVDPFAAALVARDAGAARAEAERLIGLGPGLTPEGDDLVAGALAISAVLYGELPGVLPGDLRERTTRLSATLLELAARGAVMEPVHGLLGPRWEAALRRLLRVGHSTGRAYAGAVGAVMRCSSPAPDPPGRHRRAAVGRGS
jgi:hypothetical protein